MKKTRGILALLLLACLMATNTSHALSPEQPAQEPPLEILSVNLYVDVAADNSYKVLEEVAVRFNQPYLRGITRDIPNRTSYGKPIAITKVSTSPHTATITSGADLFRIAIGDPYQYANPIEHYRITYHYTVGDDANPQSDGLHLPLIDAYRDIPIKRVSFIINMPKDFDTSAIQFSLFPQGTPLSIRRESNSIIGLYEQPLQAHQGIQFNMRLPQGYFDQVTPDTFLAQDFIKTFPYLFPTLFLASLIIWISIGKAPQNARNPKPKAMPPRGITPLETGYISTKSLGPKHYVATLVDWAQRGHIRIIEHATPHGLSFKHRQNTFTLQRISPLPPDSRPYEHKLFETIFSQLDAPHLNTLGEEVQDTINLANLQKRISPTLECIERLVKTRFRKDKVFRLKGVPSRLSTTTIALISYAMLISVGIGVGFYHNPYNFNENLTYSALIGAAIEALIFLATRGLRQVNRNIPVSQQVIKGISLTALGLAIALLYYVTWIYTMAPHLFLWGLVGYSIGVMAALCDKLTPHAQIWVSDILSLRAYIETSEPIDVASMASVRPELFCQILPYAIALEQAEGWSRLFERSPLPTPDWYQSPNFQSDKRQTINTVYLAHQLDFFSKIVEEIFKH